MSVARIRNRRSLAFTVAFAILLALAVPFAGVALADPDNTTPALDVTAETATNAVNSFHTLTAVLSGTGAAAGVEVDFEVDCTTGCTSATYTRVGTTGAPSAPQIGGPVSAFESGVEGDQTAGTVDDTRDTPELSCTAIADIDTVTAGAQPGCTVSYSRTASAGTDLIAGWVDQNKTNEANDSDVSEGRDAATAPGATSEPDDTDVVQKDWFTQTAANTRLDCDDAGTDTATPDTETNAPGATETYTCTVWNNNATTGNTTDDTGIAGVVIDAENLDGANDPDDSAALGTADYNNACTTGANGSCTYNLVPSKGETGTADVCFWIDEDNDTEFAPAGSAFDGGACGGETAAADEYPTVQTGTPGDAQATTDKVQKTWATPAPATLDAEPEVDNNASGTSHTVTATLVDQFGNPSPSIAVDFKIRSGRNVALGTVCNDTLTNASGVATCTYTDAGTAATSGTDVISVYQDGQEDVSEARDSSGGGAGGTAEPDRTDVVTKIWTTGGPPAAGTIIVDMVTGNGCTQAADSADSEEVGTGNPICGTVTDATAATIAGKTVTLSYTGPGEFGTDTNANGQLDASEKKGTSTTVTTDEAGRFDATLFSTATGTGTVTGTADTKSDTGTKTWTTPSISAATPTAAGGNGRNIDCEPETATNPPGTTHVVVCTVKDRYGNPVPGVSVTPTESGPGRLSNTAAVLTDANGQVEFVTSTTADETGDETITGQITNDVGDVDGTADVDDVCDQVAGTALAAEPGPAGTGQVNAPAGNCEDSVTKTWGSPPAPTEVNHARNVKITNFRHVKIPGKKGHGLIVKGRVSTPDGYSACHQAVGVKVQIRVGGEWITRKSDVTNNNGVWKVLIRDVAAKYRAVATEHQISDVVANEVHICLRAEDTRRHRH